MRTYSDADVVAVLVARVSASSYRAVAREIGIDHAYLCRTLNGDIELPESIAVAAGFDPLHRPERKWKRK